MAKSKSRRIKDIEEKEVEIPDTKALAEIERVLPQAEVDKIIAGEFDVTDQVPAEELKKAAEYISTLVKQSLSHQRYKKRMKENDFWWDTYEDVSPPRTLPWTGAANVSAPLTSNAVDGFLPRVIGASMGVSPYISIESNNKNDLTKAPKLTNFLQFWNENKIKLYDKFAYASLVKLVEGHVTNIVIWRNHNIRSHKLKRMMIYAKAKGRGIRYVDPERLSQLEMALADGYVPTGETAWKLVDENSSKYQGPDMTVLESEEYICPISASLANPPIWEARRFQLLQSDMIMRAVEKFYIPSVVKKILSKKYGKPHGMEIKGRSVFQDFEVQGFHESHDCIQWWGPYKFKKDKFVRQYVFTIHLDAEEMVKAQYHPYNHGESPFHHNRLFVTKRDFFGFGLPKALRHPQWAISELISQRLDTGYLQNCLNYKYIEGRFDPEANPFAPGRGMAVKSMDDVDVIQWSGASRNFDIAEEQNLRTWAERRAGIGSIQEGQPDAKQRTARGVIALLREGSLRFDKPIRDDQNWLEDTYKQEVQLFQQNIPQKGIAFERINADVEGYLSGEYELEELFPIMSPEDVQGSYNYTAMGNSRIAVRELDQQLNTLLYQTLQGNPVVNSSARAVYRLTRDLVDSFDKKKDILPTEEEFIGTTQGSINKQSTLESLGETERAAVKEFAAKKGIPIEEAIKLLNQVKNKTDQQPLGSPQTPPPPPSVSPGGFGEEE